MTFTESVIIAIGLSGLALFGYGVLKVVRNGRGEALNTYAPPPEIMQELDQKKALILEATQQMMSDQIDLAQFATIAGFIKSLPESTPIRPPIHTALKRHRRSKAEIAADKAPKKTLQELGIEDIDKPIQKPPKEEKPEKPSLV